MTVLPFRLKDKWFGLELDHIRGIESSGKIALMPNAQAPLAGLMQKNGKIFPIWNLFPLVQGKADLIKTCDYCIEIDNHQKTIFLPVHEVKAATAINRSWVFAPIYELKIHRCLTAKDVELIDMPSVEEIDDSKHFPTETPRHLFSLEEIFPQSDLPNDLDSLDS